MCSETLWFKYRGPNSYPRLAHLKDDKSLRYYGDFCFKSSSPCFTSPKIEMNNVTGELTIKGLQLNDEDNYYYFCGIADQWPKYELLRLEIYGTSSDKYN